MELMPKLNNYDIDVLVAIGNASQDEFSREEIKKLLTDKILKLHSPMFFLLNKFKKSNNILKCAYARSILIRLNDENFLIDDNLMDEILSLVSLEDLAIYGSEVISLEIRNKCSKIVWNSLMFDDSSEFAKKNVMYCKRKIIYKLR